MLWCTACFEALSGSDETTDKTKNAIEGGGAKGDGGGGGVGRFGIGTPTANVSICVGDGGGIDNDGDSSGVRGKSGIRTPTTSALEASITREAGGGGDGSSDGVRSSRFGSGIGIGIPTTSSLDTFSAVLFIGGGRT
ncbi:loricrin-like [Selaginella moellendorffii]|uniref:loricrin-like n=1 Tax=Selaginella moellendorffii TaxID=88036 RepID=UPI000D1C413B|nr:loricrin-like [Selaginella moellendorffii]|eukprot:XP_024530708.1 loricrin-like [Selaginella moellendorffii]